jgi:hypothetical protein
LVAQPLILAAHIGDLALLERQPQRVERGPPVLALAQQRAEKGKAVGLLIAVGRTLIGDIGSARRLLEQHRALAVIARADLLDGMGEAQPGGGIVGRGGDDLVEHLHTSAEIVLGERGVGIVLELIDGFGRRPGVGLDLGFKLDRAGGEIVIGEGLVRGSRGQAGNGQAGCGNRSHEAGAKRREHRKSSQRRAKD